MYVAQGSFGRASKLLNSQQANTNNPYPDNTWIAQMGYPGHCQIEDRIGPIRIDQDKNRSVKL